MAVVALARKLAVLIWHLLHQGEPYRYAVPASTRTKLRALVPREQRTRARRLPATLDQVYTEAGIPLPGPASTGERRAATSNRRTRTRLAPKG